MSRRSTSTPMPHWPKIARTGLLRMAIVLWLPFCCCQLQGAWALVGGGDAPEVSSACGGACCESSADRGTSPDEGETGDGESQEPCASSCCVRGEAIPPKWELPAGRDLGVVLVATSRSHADLPPSIEESGPTTSVPDPPWASPARARVRLQV
ncbi:MAG: hypothetical protein ACO3YY_06010 [Phycisphaerales bacterium]